ncbi:ArsR/SmtB family transcription factor [Komagataeibacter sucrofermentans]|uniref:ArsR family transcriptional regulator n=1 Tax=Komagataeibacter sucrofermentans TaxID=1053551 RepID=A0A318QEJ9_9PROT|nr:metalloregulator ArsR/SmtB family transcription factor [Komagataeibacter sucrofermentans]PYD78046.1 ArsR family transcriptional regulator [Komagataeibacter sucrofermentans]GBQ51360.1 SAM-dependent methyltransferase [Komagataeibacter sucrofermentans DSM 15973]
MQTPVIIFQALADQTRLRILALLRNMELSVGEIAQVLGQSQPRVSRHIKTLVQAGLIARRKEGNWVFLTLDHKTEMAPVYDAVASWPSGSDPEIMADSERLRAVRSVRAAAAEEYFETHAVEWDAIRSLHVSEQDVESAIRRIVGKGVIHHLVDIGTGTGRMIELLAPQAQLITGFDRSPAMLRVARTNLAAAGLERAALRQGDIYSLPQASGSVDLAVMHQVLHYVQHPAAAIAEAARILSPDGRLLVVDFAQHGRTELRDLNAHLHLGFNDSQMRNWFAEAGLTCTETTYLEGELTVGLWSGGRF